MSVPEVGGTPGVPFGVIPVTETRATGVHSRGDHTAAGMPGVRERSYTPSPEATDRPSTIFGPDITVLGEVRSFYQSKEDTQQGGQKRTLLDESAIGGLLTGVATGRKKVVQVLHRERGRGGQGTRFHLYLSQPFIRPDTNPNDGQEKTFRQDFAQEAVQNDEEALENGDVPTPEVVADAEQLVQETEEYLKDVAFAVPVGARGVEIPRDHVEKLLGHREEEAEDGEENVGHKHWARIELNFVKPRQEGRQQPDPQTLSIEDHIAGWFEDPFTIVTSSEQLSTEELDRQIETARLQAGRGNSTDADERNEAKRNEELLDVLKEGKRNGLFKTSLVIGADSPEVLANLCGRLREVIHTNPSIETTLHPELFDTAELAAEAPTQVEQKYRNGIPREDLVRLFPKRLENEVQGISITNREKHALQIPNADKIPAERRMTLGRIEDQFGREGEPIVIDSKSTEMGAAVFGRTGSGKTKLMERYLIEYVLTASRFARRENGKVVRDKSGKSFAKSEVKSAIYINPKPTQPGEQDVAQDLANAFYVDPEDPDGPKHKINVNRIKIGDLDSVGVGINPLDPGDTPLDEYADKLIAILTKSFGMGNSNVDGLATETIKRFMDRAIKGDRDFEGIYSRFGWDIQTGEAKVPGSDPKLPSMWDLIDVIEEAALAQEYGQGTEAANVVAWIKSIQMRKATGKAKSFYEGEPLDIGKLFHAEGNEANVTVIDVSALGEDEQALIMGLIALKVEDYLTRHKETEGLLVLDEANTLLDVQGELASRFEKITETIRSSHGSLLYGAQSPHLISERILGNIAHKFSMALQGRANLESMAGLMTRLTPEQLNELSEFQMAEVLYQGWGMPPVRGHVTDLTEWVTWEHPEHNIPPGSAVNLAKEADAEHRMTTRERLKLDDKFTKEDEGRALTLLAVTVTFNRLFGLDKQVALDDPYMKKKGITMFDKVKVLSPRDQSYLIDQAARQAVISQSEFFNQLPAALEGARLLLKQYMRDKIYEHVQTARDGVPFDLDNPDDATALEAFRQSLTLPTEAEIAHLPKEEREKIFTREQLTFLNQGVEVTGNNCLEQIEALKVAIKGKSLDAVIERVKREMVAALEGADVNTEVDQEFMIPGFNLAPKALITEYILEKVKEKEESLARDGKSFATNLPDSHPDTKMGFQQTIPPLDSEKLRAVTAGKGITSADGKPLPNAVVQLNAVVLPADFVKIILANNPRRDGTLIDRMVGSTFAKAVKRGTMEEWKAAFDTVSSCVKAGNHGQLIYNQLLEAVQIKQREIQSTQQGFGGLAEALKAIVEQQQVIMHKLTGGGPQVEAGTNPILMQQLLTLAEQQSRIELMLLQGGRMPEGAMLNASTSLIPGEFIPGGQERGLSLFDYDKERARQVVKELKSEDLDKLADIITEKDLEELKLEQEAVGNQSEFTAQTKAFQKARVLIRLKRLQAPDQPVNTDEIATMCVTRDVIKGMSEGAPDAAIDRAVGVSRGNFAGVLDKIIADGTWEFGEDAKTEIILNALKMGMSPFRTVDTVFSDPELYTEALKATFGSLDRFIQYSMIQDNLIDQSTIRARSIVSIYTAKRSQGRAAIREALAINHALTDTMARRIWGDDAVNALPLHMRDWLASYGMTNDPETDEREKYDATLNLLTFINEGGFTGFSGEMLKELTSDTGTHKDRIDRIERIYSEHMRESIQFHMAAFTKYDPFISNIENLSAYLENHGPDSPVFRGVSDRLKIESEIAKVNEMVIVGNYEQAGELISRLRKAWMPVARFVHANRDNTKAMMTYLQAFYSETGRMIDLYEQDARDSDVEERLVISDGMDANKRTELLFAMKRRSGINKMLSDLTTVIGGGAV